MRIKKSDIEKQYQHAPSFSDLLPWVEWSDDEDAVLLEDLTSVGALLEIKDFSSESKPISFIHGKHDQIVNAFTQVMPLEDTNPWVIQIFVQDDLTLDSFYRQLENYIDEVGNLNDPFTQKYLEVMKHHFELMTKEEGILIDPLSNLPYKGKTRRIRLAVYRRYSDLKEKKQKINQIEELQITVERLISQLDQIGLKVRRLKGHHFYEWLVRWFNPKPQLTEGNVDKLLDKFPYPKDKPFGWNLTQNIFFGSIESDEKSWSFDGLKHKALVLNELNNEIDIGVISRERPFGENEKYALLDKFPNGAIYSMHIIFESTKAIHKQLTHIEKSAIGKSTLVHTIADKVKQTRQDIDQGDTLVRTVEAIFICGKSDEELKSQEIQLSSLLSGSGLTFLDSHEELFPKDTYLRFLPFNYSYEFDKKYMYRSTYKYKDAAVRLLPVFGRSRGDQVNPLHVYFNRGGEPFIFDQLSKRFRQSNSHMAIIGTTGAGKSALLNTHIMSLSAVYNPRVIVVETGGSMDYTEKFLNKYGRKTKALRFSRMYPIALNPYVEAYDALEQIEIEEALIAKNEIRSGKDPDAEGIEEEYLSAKVNKQLEEFESQDERATDEERAQEEDRDLLNEMALATRTMITGGIDEEEKNISRADMMLINRVLIHAMKKCRENGVEQMLVQHVIASFSEMANQEENPAIQKRLAAFSLSMEEYQTGLKAKFINRASEPLPDVDFLQIEFGFLQEEKYVDLLNVVFITLLSKILAMAEKGKNAGRPTILILDEIHVLLKSKMVSSVLTLISKVGRKFDLWLVPATQNVSDFNSVESKKFLSMMETWICLAFSGDEEIRLVDSFKGLTQEEIDLIKGIEKFPGIYAEGVLLGKRHQGLFRNVPPRICLALAMTDPDERAYRQKVQKELGVDDPIIAIEHIAAQMEKSTQKKQQKASVFYD